MVLLYKPVGVDPCYDFMKSVWHWWLMLWQAEYCSYGVTAIICTGRHNLNKEQSIHAEPGDSRLGNQSNKYHATWDQCELINHWCWSCNILWTWSVINLNGPEKANQSINQSTHFTADDQSLHSSISPWINAPILGSENVIFLRPGY